MVFGVFGTKWLIPEKYFLMMTKLGVFSQLIRIYLMIDGGWSELM